VAQKFTGQRLDGSGLYYYNARYYDPDLGRFISPDTIVQDPTNPQNLNRYSYCLNNPLKYTDPSGHGWWSIFTDIASVGFDIYQLATNPSWGNVGFLLGDVALTLLPGVPAGLGPAAKAGKAGIEASHFASGAVRAGERGAGIAEELARAEKEADSVASITKKIPNPNGRKGGTLHQNTIQDLKDYFKSQGWEVKTEFGVKTPGGIKNSRAADLWIKSPEGDAWLIQVGRRTLSGNPVSRELKAIKDLDMTPWKDRTIFIPCN
jgi:RHS repeat-associated protein